MSRENVEIARTPIGPDSRLPSRRTLDERVYVRWPGAYPAIGRALSRLPPRSRLRRALLRRAVLSGWAAWTRGDLDLMLVRYAPDWHLEVPADLIAAGMRSSYHGHSGVRELAADVRDAWEREEFMPQEIVDAGNPVVVLGHRRVRALSGIEFDHPVAHIYWHERGLTVREHQFTDWDEGLRAAGIPTGP